MVSECALGGIEIVATNVEAAQGVKNGVDTLLLFASNGSPIWCPQAAVAKDFAATIDVNHLKHVDGDFVAVFAFGNQALYEALIGLSHDVPSCQPCANECCYFPYYTQLRDRA